MTTEKRLAEIHDRVELSKPIDVMVGSYTYFYLKDVPWLLELVGMQEMCLQLRSEHIGKLEERV